MAILLLVMLLLFSAILNGLFWYRWKMYRSRPAGLHSHTGMIPVQRKTSE